MRELVERIASRTASIGVIGLGHVGLAVAAAFADAGFRVIGVDIVPERVERINAGECPIAGNEPELPALVAKVTSRGRLAATTDYARLGDVDVVLVDVETPVGADRRPRFDALRSACHALGAVMKEGVLVVVESTVAPGTCEGLVVPWLAEASGMRPDVDFFVGHCPERVMPGRLLKNLRELARVCGASTPASQESMISLYRTIVGGKLDAADCLTAEIVKTAENAYRDVNIAFANELGLVCEAVGADFARVRELVNESPGRDVLAAGAGVGGPCIPKDPWLLVQGLPPSESRLVAAARAVNDSMPLHVARLVQDALAEAGTDVRGAQIVVLGYAYRENSDVTHNSPSRVLAERLERWGAAVRFHDPRVAPYAGDLGDAVAGADAAVVMVAHDEYRELDLSALAAALRARVLVDGRDVVRSQDAADAGLVFRAVGRGARPRVESAAPTAKREELPEHLASVGEASHAGSAVRLVQANGKLDDRFA